MTKKFLKNQTVIGLVVLLLLLFTVNLTMAQVSRTLNIGDLRYSCNEAMNGDHIVWPNLWDQYGQINNNHLQMLQTYGVVIGQKLTWDDPTGVSWDVQTAMSIQNKFNDQANVLVPPSGAFQRIYHDTYPVKMLDGTDWTPINAKGDPVDSNIPADAEIYAKWDVWPNYNGGMELERWIYSFVNKDYTDIVFQEFVLKNTSSTPRKDVYFAINSQTSAHDYYGSHDRWGSYYGVTYWKYLQGDATADSLRMWYSWDADIVSTAEDERGAPDEQWGNLEEPQVFTFSVVHADKSASDESDDPRQPVKVQQAQRDKWPDLSQATHPSIYDFITAETPVDLTTQYSHAVDSTGADNPNGRYEVLIDGFNDRNFDSVTEEEKSCMFSFGPYQLAPGEDVRVVIAYTGGTISQRLAIDAGRAYDAGYPQRQTFGVVPMPYDVYDLQGNKFISAGDILTMQQKDDLVNKISKGLAFRNAAKALKLWQNSSVKNGAGSFDMDLPPASPSITGTSENDQIRLQWGSVSGATKYRIYREYKRPPSKTEPTDTLWFYDPKNNQEYVESTGNEFVDTNVIRGEDYYYYITAVDANGLESSMFLNRTGTSGTKSDEALSATRGPDTGWKDNVVVIPNPYHAAGADKYSGRKLNFLNLPAYCNIHIYTMLGDKVQTIVHNSATGDDSWERQDTFSTMEVVSGIYLYVVEETDANGAPTGEKAIGKFVVIK